MITFSLQSGSNGNAIYVEAGDTRLLFDAGISAVCARRRMAAHGRDPHDLDALFISHEHGDHIRCAGVFHRMFNVPIYITRKTHLACRVDLGKLSDVRYFTAGDTITLDGVSVRTVSTAHDAADGVAFVVEAAGRRLGVLTDLGHPFAELANVLGYVDAAYLECNYDPDMLEAGPYPRVLKRRISGGAGHLSNDEAAELVRACGKSRPSWIATAHLSAENNHPELALATCQRVLGQDYPIHATHRHECSDLLTV